MHRVRDCGTNRSRASQSPWLYGVTHPLVCALPAVHSWSGRSIFGPRCLNGPTPRISSTSPIVLDHPRHSAHTRPMLTRARFEEETLPSCAPVELQLRFGAQSVASERDAAAAQRPSPLSPSHPLSLGDLRGSDMEPNIQWLQYGAMPFWLVTH